MTPTRELALQIFGIARDLLLNHSQTYGVIMVKFWCAHYSTPYINLCFREERIDALKPRNLRRESTSLCISSL